MGWLVLNHDGTDLVVHKLLGEVITIGRVPLNHVVIDNPTVSAQHAILARLGDSYRLKDLHSTNGTQVNGVSITDAELKDGDKIRFGSVVAVLCGRSHSSEAAGRAVRRPKRLRLAWLPIIWPNARQFRFVN